ncbi:unnamed protein product [Phytomonas sp. Hart1]|nr:unnamed protein product [Phytomonas sp. Hart1]|eukprot:CCW69343.1 unnamed protein product [Phytomonas sp. isolate Hart1]
MQNAFGVVLGSHCNPLSFNSYNRETCVSMIENLVKIPPPSPFCRKTRPRGRKWRYFQHFLTRPRTHTSWPIQYGPTI